jgi:essential nuclear protein 1
MPYTGAQSVFIATLLSKKYALPLKVIDALVAHFGGFSDAAPPLPVKWHQALLIFAQRYKSELSQEQRATLLALTKSHPHPLISPEVRRELLADARKKLDVD